MPCTICVSSIMSRVSRPWPSCSVTVLMSVRLVHVSNEVHSLADLENKRIVPRTWAPFPRNVVLSPDLLDDAKMPPLNRPTDDYVFQLCSLFSVRPSFSDALTQILDAARNQSDVISKWAMDNGKTTQHLRDYYVGYKQRSVPTQMFVNQWS